jgi:hypothetical protein
VASDLWVPSFKEAADRRYIWGGEDMARAPLGTDDMDLIFRKGQACDGVASTVDARIGIEPVEPFGGLHHHGREDGVGRQPPDLLDKPFNASSGASSGR